MRQSLANKARYCYCQMSNLILLETVSRDRLYFVVSPFENQKVQYTFQVRTCCLLVISVKQEAQLLQRKRASNITLSYSAKRHFDMLTF